MRAAFQCFRRPAQGKTEIAGNLCGRSMGGVIFVRKIVHNLDNKIDLHHRLPIHHGRTKVISKDET